MEVGLLLIHVVIGTLLAGHGAHKLFGILGGYGLEGTGGYMESFGLRPGKLFAAAAGGAELSGGLLLAGGLFTPLAATLIAATMFVARAHRSRRQGSVDLQRRAAPPHGFRDWNRPLDRLMNNCAGAGWPGARAFS